MSVSNLIDHTDNVTDNYLELSSDWEFFLLNITNDTDGLLTTEPRDLWQEIPLGVVLTLLCLMTIIGNAMVLHAVRTERRLQTVRFIRAMLRGNLCFAFQTRRDSYQSVHAQNLFRGFKSMIEKL